jgi:hypothetical protein
MELPLEWDNVVVSVATKGSGQRCILYRCVRVGLFDEKQKVKEARYSDYGCNGPSLEVTGYIPELPNFENQVSSFRCFADFADS